MSRISKQLIALSLLITSSLAISMNRPAIHQDIIVQRVTAVDNPVRAAFLNKKNSLAIGGKEGIYQVNWKQNKTTSKIIPTSQSHSFLINQQRDAVAAIDIFDNKDTNEISGAIKLYNTTNQKLDWENSFRGEKPSFTFTPSGKLYVFGQNGTIRCNDGKSYHVPQVTRMHEGAITTDNAAEEVIFTTDYINKSCSELYTVHFDAKSSAITEHLILNNEIDTAKARVHSPFSKIVALHYSCKNVWMLYDRSNKRRVITDRHLNNCCSFVFHPKNESLLAIITKDGFVEIYDFRKDKIISKTNNSLWISTSDSPLTQSSIDFSEDTENLVVTVGTKDKDNNRCFVLSNLSPKNN